MIPDKKPRIRKKMDRDIQQMILLGTATFLIWYVSIIFIPLIPYAPGHSPPVAKYSVMDVVIPTVRVLGWTSFVTTNPVAGIPTLTLSGLK